jgi:hypothetical protein
MFPSGAPELALMLLRLFVGAVLVCDAVTAVSALNAVLVCVLLALAPIVSGVALSLLGPTAYLLDQQGSKQWR